MREYEWKNGAPITAWPEWLAQAYSRSLEENNSLHDVEFSEYTDGRRKVSFFWIKDHEGRLHCLNDGDIIVLEEGRIAVLNQQLLSEVRSKLKMDGSTLIGNVREVFNGIYRPIRRWGEKGDAWRAFYNGWIEGRARLMFAESFEKSEGGERLPVSKIDYGYICNCGMCGHELITVRPGKHQCDNELCPGNKIEGEK